MFDVASYTYGLPDIAAHMHTLEGKRPETIKAQQRILAKWLGHRDKLHAFTKKGHDEVNAWQFEKIATLVDFVFSTHPFYHQLYKSAGFRRGDLVTWSDYNALPTITKKDIIQNYDMFTANLDQNSGENITARTSGSSGQALTMHFDPAMIDHDLLHCLRFNEQMLGRSRDPAEWQYLVYLATPPFTSFDGAFPTFTISNECPADSVLAHLRKIKPAVLSGIPSYLSRLADLVEDPKELGIQAICTNSEPSTKAERVKIAERLGAPVFDEYSSVELCLIATECKEGKYHIVEDNVRVDVLNPDQQGMGEIVATNLLNTYMPLIRYRQGDIIQIGSTDDKCGCGNCFRHLGSFLGRTDQQLQSRTIGSVPSDLIMALYDRTLLSSDAAVEEFQIVQTKPDKVSLIVVPALGSNPNQRVISHFTEGLKDIFKDPGLEVQVEEVGALPPSKSYKRRLIENRITL